jgi:hypothetical protein
MGPRDRGGTSPVAANAGSSRGGRKKGNEAGDGIRTHDNHVGNVVLYQLSYTRDPSIAVGCDREPSDYRGAQGRRKITLWARPDF